MKSNTNSASVLRSQIQKLCVAAIFMAMTVALSSFGIPVPGGHLYLNDIVICTAAIILDPFYAFVAGGVGAFLGDLLFYPTPMFVSLATHGLQAVVISIFSHYIMKDRRVLASGIGVAIGAVIMVVGYSLGRAFIYSTPEYAVLKLPYQILQAVVGAVVGMLLCWKCNLVKIYENTQKKYAPKKPATVEASTEPTAETTVKTTVETAAEENLKTDKTASDKNEKANSTENK